MSNEEHQYMRNVKWVTFGYAAFAVASLLIGGAFGVAAIKSDIKDTQTQSKEYYVATNHKMDSIQHDNRTEISNIWSAIKALQPEKETKTIVKYLPAKKPKGSFFTQKWINGKLFMIPVEIN